MHTNYSKAPSVKYNQRMPPSGKHINYSAPSIGKQDNYTPPPNHKHNNQ